MTIARERRMKRSSDPLVALHYQLAQAKQGASLDALVLADTSGVVVAGAGSWVVCEEIAAYAPFLAQDDGGTLPERVASMRGEVEILSMTAAGQPLLLCALRGSGGSGTRSEATKQAIAGCARILETTL
jgi:hypothetical protein